MWAPLSLTLAAAFAASVSAPFQGRVFVEGPRMAAPLLGAPDHIAMDISLAPEAGAMQAFFDQGMAQFHGGWLSEAARSFQTILIEDPDCAMAYWGLAQANLEWPTRAAWFARAAWLKRGLAAPTEQRLIDALAKFHGVLGPDEPPGMAEPWNLAPGVERLAPLVLAEQESYSDASVVGLLLDYSSILEEDPENVEVRALLVEHLVRARRERPALSRQIAELQPDRIEEQAQLVFARAPQHPVLRSQIRMWLAEGQPGRVAEAADLLIQASPAVSTSWFLAGHVKAETGDGRHALELYERGKAVTFEHSRRTWQDPAAWAADWNQWDPVQASIDLRARLSGSALDVPLPQAVEWEPLRAPDWSLPDAYGGDHALADYRGQPVLVVNFLGFGCVHCLEQLQAIKPLADRFEEAGIAIVAIGLQDPADLATSLGEDPTATGYPFPILCDSGLDQFRSYGAYDDFADTELHGTYLIDGEGKVRWSDISHLPFMEIEDLLERQQDLLMPASR